MGLDLMCWKFEDCANFLTIGSVSVVLFFCFLYIVLINTWCDVMEEVVFC